MRVARRAARVDANQPEIVATLRKAGYSVAPGFDDILVGKNGVTLWVEIKADGKKRQLKESQKALLRDWRGAYLVASSADEIMAWEGWR
jgi:hypothetical protein